MYKIVCYIYKKNPAFIKKQGAPNYIYKKN
jgi:hypothetical protein